MKRSLKTALLVSSILLFAVPPCGEVRSCVFYPEWDETRILFFNPALSSEASLRPFAYTAHLYFGETMLWDDEDGCQKGAEKSLTIEDYRRNCREWQGFIGQNTDLFDIEKVLYGDKADVFLTALADSSLQAEYPGNGFVKKLLDPQNRAALEYVKFAKTLEFQQLEGQSDPWGNSYTDNEERCVQMLQTAREQVQLATSDFLRKRWAYQLIILQYYTEKGSEIAATFQQYFSDSDASILKSWALLKVAETEPDSVKANYLYAKVFDQCHSKRLRAAALFRSPLTEATVALAKTPQEKSVVLTMRAMQYPGRALSYLRRIVGYAPESRYLPLLVVREINKLEDWLLSNKLTGLDPFQGDAPEYNWDDPNYHKKLDIWKIKNAKKDQEYLREFRGWLENQAAKSHAPQLKNLLTLAVAHLYLMENNPAKCRAWLDKVSGNKSPEIALQQTLEEILLLPEFEDINTPVVQEKLVNYLLKLRGSARLLSLAPEQQGRVFLWLAHAFFHKGNVAVAGLFFNRSWLTTGTDRDLTSWNYRYQCMSFYDNFATVADVDALLKLIEKRPKTAFETFITSKFHPAEFSSEMGMEWFYDENIMDFFPVPARERLLDLQGTIAFRNGDLNQALKSFSQMPADYWEKDENAQSLLANDFTGTTDSLPIQTLPHAKASKARFVQSIITLEAEANANPAKRAENYYRIANAYFHASFWGKAWYMTSYGRSQYDIPGKKGRNVAHMGYLPDECYKDDYFHCARAAAWYKKVLSENPPKELSAKAAFMLAYIDQINRRFKMREEGHDEMPDDIHSPLFRQWKKQYGNTETYAKQMRTCPGLKDYLGG